MAKQSVVGEKERLRRLIAAYEADITALVLDYWEMCGERPRESRRVEHCEIIDCVSDTASALSRYQRKLREYHRYGLYDGPVWVEREFKNE